MKLKILIKMFVHNDQFRKNGVEVDHTEMSNPIEYVLPFIKKEFEIVSNEAEADVIFASVLTVGYNEFCEYAIEHANKKIIVGGYHPSISPEDFYDFKNVTIVVGGGESVINDALLFGKKVYYGEQADIIPMRLSFPKIVRYPDKKFISIRTFTGCNKKCGYCCHGLVYDKIVTFSLSNIIKDIEYQKPFGVFVTDSNFLISPIFTDLINYCSKNNILMRFYGFIDDLTEGIVRILNNTNFEIIVGLEKEYYNESKIDLFNKLTIKKIGCIIRISKEQNFNKIKEKFKCENYSEMYLMPFPKTVVGEQYNIPKRLYHKLNPKEGYLLYKFKKG